MSGPFGSSQWMYNSSTEFYGFDIENSLRFDGSAYLTRTLGSAGNRKTYTLSVWVKRWKFDGEQFFYCSGGSDLNDFGGPEFIGNTIGFQNYNSGTQVIAQSTELFKDPAAWYNIVYAVDTTQGTLANRLKVYVNGSQLSGFVMTDSDFSQNYEGQINTNGQVHNIGARHPSPSGGTGHFYLAEYNFIDGSALTPASFGETKENIWIPKDTSGLTFGTQGFRLEFKNSAVGSASSSTVGADTSGNNHHFDSSNGFATTDNMIDSPTDNFCTLNPWNKNSVFTLSDGNLSFTASNNRFIASTFAVNSGKWYLEFSPTAGGGSGVGVGIILATTDVSGSAGFANSGTYTGVGYTTNGNKYVDSVAASYGDSYGSGNVIAIALDLDSSPQTIAFYKDNSSQGSINISPSNGTWTIATDFSHAGTHSINFGQLAFTHTPPTGFVALSTANLPDPAINPAQGENPTEYFNTVIWSGDGTSSRSITTGHQPDWVWTKERNSAINHIAQDSILGTGKYLHPNTTAAEQSASTLITSFDSNGFTIGNSGSINGSSDTYVAWSWKAGTSFSNDASATSVGTIDSTGTVSTEAGFSVISYTGTGSAGTVAHGLGTVPEWIILKSREDGSANWAVYHVSVGAAKNFFLNSTNDADTDGAIFFDSTTPTSSVFTLGGSGAGQVNESGEAFIAYCFAPKEGFSKFGTYDDAYISDYDIDSPFVYTGFRPAWLMIKGDANGREWVMYDNKRTPDDGVYLRANTSAAEQTDASNHDISFLSNGFKIRGGSGDINTTNESYVYMAFADQPFKFANGGTE